MLFTAPEGSGDSRPKPGPERDARALADDAIGCGPRLAPPPVIKLQLIKHDRGVTSHGSAHADDAVGLSARNNTAVDHSEVRKRMTPALLSLRPTRRLARAH